MNLSHATLVCVGQSNPRGSGSIDIHGPIGVEVFIGRSREKCAYRCDDPMVSSVHCKITVKQVHAGMQPQIWIEDLSSNGTFVNAQRLGKGRSVPLSHLDEIGLLQPCSGPEAIDRPLFAFIVVLTGQAGDMTSLELRQHRLALTAPTATAAYGVGGTLAATVDAAAGKTWATSDAIRRARTEAKEEAEALGAEVRARAIADAVRQAKEESEESRRQAVESAANAVATQWSTMHAGRISRLPSPSPSHAHAL